MDGVSSLTAADLDQLLIDLREQGVPWPDVVSQVGLSLGVAQARHQAALEAQLANAALAAARTTPRGRITLQGSKRTWTADEDARLVDLRKKRFTFKVISQMMTARTESACQARWHLIKAAARAAEAAPARGFPSPSPSFSYATDLASPLGTSSLARAQSTNVASFGARASPSSEVAGFVPLSAGLTPDSSSHDPPQQTGPTMLPATSVQSMIEEAVEAALRRREASTSVGASGSVPPAPLAAADAAPVQPAAIETSSTTASVQKQETPAAVPMSTSPSTERKPVVVKAKDGDETPGLTGDISATDTTFRDTALQEDKATVKTAADGALPARTDGAAASTCTCLCHADHDASTASSLSSDPAVTARVSQTMEQVSTLLARAGASFSRFNELRIEAKKREWVETIV